MTEFLTKEELEELKKKLKYLETVKTQEVAELLERAISYGDLSENAAYSEAKEQQAFLQGEILRLRELISKAKIVEKKKSNRIEIGSIVEVLLNGKKNKIKIVSPSQSDPLKGKISFESPLGKGILGRKVGDEVKVKINPEREAVCKILKIKD